MPDSTVLIVDSSADNREVLRTVLARKGLRIWEAQAAEQGLALAREHRPDVIVLDLEAESLAAEEVRQQYSLAAADQASRLIVLGKARRRPASTGGHVISKPYHFASLVHTIEQLAAKAA